jgi:acetyl-CoA synthetase
MTCSGGDSAVAADLAAALGLRLPALAPRTVARLQETLPEAATAANPLDYTALLWYDGEALRELVLALGDDPAIDRVLVLFDSAMHVGGDVEQSWAGIVTAVRAAGAVSPVPVALASTLPELLDDAVAARMVEEGMPALAGLAPALRCMQALAAPAPDPERIAQIRAVATGATPGDWLAEHEAKALLRSAGLPVVDGRLAADGDDAVAAWGELGGGPVALKLSAPGLQHKSERGALLLDLDTAGEVRAGVARLRSDDAAVLVERMAPPGVELVVAARRGLVAVLVLGLGGIWTEALDDVALVPLPASPQRVERALLSLRGAALLTGGRGRPAVDLAAAARLAAGAGDLLLEAGLELLELNPVIVHAGGAVAVDALARRGEDTQRRNAT